MLKDACYCVDLNPVAQWPVFMDFETLDLNRRTRSMGIRIYEDQLEALRLLKIRKHHNRLKIADLIREAIDQYIDHEKIAK